ncbi:unnamed protein product [Clonostachys rhizophaga]|uniref:Rhodopsin domain-containing protein n=1 Tax=Clonostachys rhizophaga TaxID=160324 RepID=A0A9N9VQZ8_9HYPO|nr:unnamed protein product [Clonostachys rhizophaga]
MAEETGWHPVKPEGLALGTFITTVVLSVLCSIIVLMRMYIRAKHQSLGTDDYLMCAGWAAYIVHNAIVSTGCHQGIGTPRNKLETAQVIEGMKIFYAATLVFVKSSICVTVLRIAAGRVYIWTLRGLIILAVLMSSVGLIVILVQCRPVEAFWDSSKGTCMDKILPTILTYAASVSNVITDFVTATIPIILVRRLQMRAKLKLYAQLVMGLGILYVSLRPVDIYTQNYTWLTPTYRASIASIVRVPYSNAYLKPDDFIYQVSNIILWTVVECGVGILAGSLPSLRAFFKSLAKDKSTNPSGSYATDLVTIGQIRAGQDHSQAMELGFATVNRDADIQHEHDNDSTSHIIKSTTEFQTERAGSDEEGLCDRRYSKDSRERRS